MKICTSSEMKQIEKIAIEDIGIPALILMENAAISVADKICNAVTEAKDAVIVCGGGNNGGDGLALARILHCRGFCVSVLILGEGRTDEFKINYEIVKNIKIPIYNTNQETIDEAALNKIKNASIIIDAMFGTGFHGQTEEIYKDAVDAINAADAFVVSIDLPSGVNADNGQAAESTVEADLTVALGHLKRGHVIYPGCGYCGITELGDISLPYIDKPHNTFLTTEQRARLLLPRRTENSHKGDYGKVFVIGGSTGFTGAPVMAAEAALKTGAGLVTVGCPCTTNNIMEIKLTEAMTLPLPDDGGILGSDALDPILEKLSASHVGVIGCGMGKTRQTTRLVADIIRHSETPMVIDADALNALSENVQVLAEAQADIVLTPHFMEMSRLTGLALEEIEKNPIETAREFAKKYKTTLVLKGPNTFISEPDGTVFVNPTGNNGMACGGSGDVLSGIIGGLMAQGMKGREAAVLGVYLHGMAGDSARDCLGEYSMLPTDVINHIGKAISKIYMA